MLGGILREYTARRSKRRSCNLTMRAFRLTGALAIRKSYP
jgi:hypothetical protein